MRGPSYFFLSVLVHVSSATIKVTGFIGHNVTLPCSYDVRTYGVLSFCWGRGKVPTSKCSNTILSSQDGVVDFRQSPRYQVLGRVTDGKVSLTVLNAQRGDAGVYGCRVEIPGWFNDYKVNTYLSMEEEPVEKPVTPVYKLSTSDKIVTTSTSELNVEVTDLTMDMNRVTKKEEFKAFLKVDNLGRMAAIFFFTLIIILAFIFWRMFVSKEKLQHLDISAVENTYESIPMSR
ncbi:hepatitis A virus cellular receptor 1 homolog isoform X1 [Parambassis ranga]|uniref:Hepatitis A virus cellular receptor 1 homolog isoform X1 n=1 Tax=Parambassis ranga TaxID=210632 RepID=A0A6P7J5P9_9TELE|nr:hepatitis A virus cellular receptor 1 homolog isoform X1 [Parambassis ranga]